MKLLNIMIVDDDWTTLEVLGAVLEKEGHVVTKRDSALGTMAAVLQVKPDVVLLDVRMPGLSGDRLASIMNERDGAHGPLVILHSSSPRAELEAFARVSGAAGFVEKTADPSEFYKRFETAVRAALQRGATPPSTSRKVR